MRLNLSTRFLVLLSLVLSWSGYSFKLNIPARFPGVSNITNGEGLALPFYALQVSVDCRDPRQAVPSSAFVLDRSPTVLSDQLGGAIQTYGGPVHDHFGVAPGLPGYVFAPVGDSTAYFNSENQQWEYHNIWGEGLGKFRVHLGFEKKWKDCRIYTFLCSSPECAKHYRSDFEEVVKAD